MGNEREIHETRPEQADRDKIQDKIAVQHGNLRPAGALNPLGMRKATNLGPAVSRFPIRGKTGNHYQENDLLQKRMLRYRPVLPAT